MRYLICNTCDVSLWWIGLGRKSSRMEMKVEKSRKWFVFNSANAEQNKQRGEPQHLRVSELVKCCIFPSHPRSPLPPKVSIPLLRYAEISRIDIRLLRVKITSLQRSRARKKIGKSKNTKGELGIEGAVRILSVVLSDIYLTFFAVEAGILGPAFSAMRKRRRKSSFIFMRWPSESGLKWLVPISHNFVVFNKKEREWYKREGNTDKKSETCKSWWKEKSIVTVVFFSCPLIRSKSVNITLSRCSVNSFLLLPRKQDQFSHQLKWWIGSVSLDMRTDSNFPTNAERKGSETRDRERKTGRKTRRLQSLAHQILIVISRSAATQLQTRGAKSDVVWFWAARKIPVFERTTWSGQCTFDLIVRLWAQCVCFLARIE